MAAGFKKTPIEDKLKAVFRPAGSVTRLVRRTKGYRQCRVKAHWGNELMVLSFNNKQKLVGELPATFPDMPVYIPVKESLSFAPGFRSLYEKYELEFEEVYYDILRLAFLPPTKGKKPRALESILKSISEAVQGTVQVEGERFYLNHRGSNLEMPLVAEGIRKLALIWQLIQNGSIYGKSVLFWDEPEANLNPSMMPHVARILVDLQALGTQIFVATHNYAFLKELELARKKASKISYFTLFFAGDEDPKEVMAGIYSSYSQVRPNAIADEYLRIYDEELKRSFGGKV